jgi:hypothetical protein
MHGKWRSRLHPPFVIGLVLSALSGGSLFAAGPYAVGTSEIDPPGKCTIESWGSWARSGDFIGVTSPACVVQFWRPVELGSEFKRDSSDGDWTSSLKVKAKTNLVSLAQSPIGVALNGNVNFNLTTGHASTASYFSLISIRLAEPLRLNLKIGGQTDLVHDRSYETWGANIEVALAPTVKVLAEVYGQDGKQPSAQAGIRITPVKDVDFEFVYGYNLADEPSSWFTFGVNLRF